MEGNSARPPIFLFTDGASSGNPGPGGYGAILRCGAREMELSGGFALTTNNRMELLAVIKGLEAIRWKNAEVHVYSDSSYVVKSVNEGWLFNWERKGFAKAKNPDLWMRFLGLYRLHRVSFHWVKGHAGHPENERCDRLAVAAGAGAVAAGKSLPDDPGFMPET
ncbi:MAG: ribonuclease HI [Clostridium sp.]|nr:ribonuclease HI [Bacteroides sp.]MCM1199088.1 ribonuclease HI [Clostridium sp.]